MPPFLPRKHLRSPSKDLEPSKSNDEGKSGTKTPQRKKTLFDALDAGPNSSRSAEQVRTLLSRLDRSDDEEDESELSSLSSGEFESEHASKRRKLAHESSDVEDEDEDIEFEDVQTYAASHLSAVPPSGDLELTLTKETRISLVNPHNKKQGPSKIERQIRVSTHCMHVQFLMWHNAIRNSWLCDKDLHNILLRQVRATSTADKEIEKWKVRSGLEIRNDEVSNAKAKQKGKGVKGMKSDVRSHRDWGMQAQTMTAGLLDKHHQDPLVPLLTFLCKYWQQRFRIYIPGLRKIGYMSLHRLDEEMRSFKETYDYERHGERIRDKKEFRTCAEKCEGSRDVGAQLFTALLRAIGLDARMVVSLQPVGFGWGKNEDAVERRIKRDKKKGKDLDTSDEESSENDIESAPLITNRSGTKIKDENKTKLRQRVRQSHGQGSEQLPIDLSASSAVEDDDSVVDVTPSRPQKRPSKLYEKDLSPNYWVEVLSPVTNSYVSVHPFGKDNPVVTKPEHFAIFEPRGAKAENAKQVMAYVVGFSSDGTAKDVTVRYLKRHMWPGKTKGVRMPVEKVPVYNHKGKVKRYEEADWFKTVMSGYARRHARRTAIDDLEEATDLLAVKPEKKEVKEGEETLQSYKSSAEFVLERHLKREEALLPNAQHVKLFTVKGKKGDDDVEEKVYLRADVVNCKSVETWHKEGREPIVGEQPLKRVPYRAATINRKRELAEAEAASGGQKMLQGLYSRDQTDWIIPPPIRNGIIPKNSYGNIDLFVESMVPEGAVHIPMRGTVKVCKKLGIDFAEAVTGFEFGMRMAIPIITGVVIAKEHLNAVMDQWEKDEAERLRKEDEKRTKASLGMWRRLLMGMRIVQRVREEYGDQADETVDALNPWTNKNAKTKMASTKEEEVSRQIMNYREEEMAGGFLPEGQDVEEPQQSIFPTRHDDDHDGVGLVVVGNTKDASTAYATPISLQSNKRVRVETSDESMAEEDATTTQHDSKARGRQKYMAAATETTESSKSSNNSRNARTAVKSSLRKPPFSKGGKKRTSPILNDEDESEESSLTDLEDSSSNESPKPKPRRRAPSHEVLKSSSRSVPKRQAARKSETALRSHYFDQSEEE